MTQQFRGRQCGQAGAGVEATTHYRSLIFSEFRVSRLVPPTAHDFIDVDRVVNVELPAVQEAIIELQGLKTSSNQAVLGPVVSGMQEQDQMAIAATPGLSAQLLAFTPARWDADHSLLSGLGSDIRAANRALQVADKVLNQADRYLEDGRYSHRGHGPGDKGEGRGHGDKGEGRGHGCTRRTMTTTGPSVSTATPSRTATTSAAPTSPTEPSISTSTTSTTLSAS